MTCLLAPRQPPAEAGPAYPAARSGVPDTRVREALALARAGRGADRVGRSPANPDHAGATG